MDHCILLLQHLSIRFAFHNKRLQTLFKDQRDRSKATFSFNQCDHFLLLQLVGLKAELFRKQEALRKERLQQNSTTVKAKPVPKVGWTWDELKWGSVWKGGYSPCSPMFDTPMEVSWPSGKEHRTQTLFFLISRVWVRIPSRDTCVLKQDTSPLLRPSDGT